MNNLNGERAQIRSPFSMEHEWTFVPTILPEPVSAGYAPMRQPLEESGLRAIGNIGCIGSVQMARLFHWRRHHVRRMLAEKKLVQHELKKNKNTIPVFTLGPRSIQLLKSDITINEWRHWEIASILRKLVFFQFCCALQDKQKAFHIQSAALPFTGKVKIGEDLRYVFVLRGESNVSAIKRELARCPQPIIVLAEKLEDVFPYSDVLSSAYLLLDTDLRGEYTFFRQIGGVWKR